ncbi:MAG: hypothetical protein JW712_00160 [Dehalococcoidales bacterium]|nr:hypothetical protein [Dehalococcoidales bacterium]
MGDKYAKHVISNPFYKADEKYGGATIFKAADETAGVTYEYYYIDSLDWAVEAQTHDTHEVLCFVGGDPREIRDLGAEIRINLGNDNEEHIINDATVVSIPAGLKHGPIAVNKFYEPVVMLRIINSKEYQDRLNAEEGEGMFMTKVLRDGHQYPKYGKKYWMNIVKGPLFIDYEPGWFGTSIWSHHNEYKSGTTLGYHCLVSNYDVEFTHAHGFHELLCFLSGDPENPTELGADVSVCLGDELEEHTFNTPTIISMPPGLKHCPLHVSNITRPVVFLEVSATKDFDKKPD